MNTDWRLLAQARGMSLSAEDLDRIVPVMQTLESAFGPLKLGIPHDIEPALILSEPAVEGE